MAERKRKPPGMPREKGMNGFAKPDPAGISAAVLIIPAYPSFPLTVGAGSSKK
jgi:hypothetical protein